MLCSKNKLQTAGREVSQNLLGLHFSINRINLHMQSFCTSRNRKIRNDVVLKEQITNSRVRSFSELVGIAFQHQQN